MTVEKEEAKTIWDKIGNLDYRIIYTIIALLVAIPIWSPIGTPMKVGACVKNYADFIYNLEAGSVVLCSFSGYATMLPDVEPIYIATWKMFLDLDIKFLVLLTHVDSPSVIQEEMKTLNPEAHGKIYGRDFMFFPYLAMGEAATITFTENIRNLFTTDFYGDSLDDFEALPIMENIHSANDIDLYIGGAEFGTRRYNVPYGIPVLTWGTATGVQPFVGPFYDPINGPVYGYVGGASQGGELEAYTGYYGPGVKMNDTKNLAIVGLIVFVIIGNIAYFGSKYKR